MFKDTWWINIQGFVLPRPTLCSFQLPKELMLQFKPGAYLLEELPLARERLVFCLIQVFN